MAVEDHRLSRVVSRMALEFGAEIRDERRPRRITIRDLAARSGLPPSVVQGLENGRPATLASYARAAGALSLRPEFHAIDGRRTSFSRAEDPVHAWMSDVEAATLQREGIVIRLDEPFQHYEFAGRADLVAWSLEGRALLHIENRTRFPNLQEAFGSFNSKRSYLASVLADRIGLRNGFATVVHVIVGLWSSEVIHTLRLRTASFRSVCPDSPDVFRDWWNQRLPVRGGTTLVLLDPIDRPRARRFVGLDDALRAASRYRGYADAVEAMGARRK